MSSQETLDESAEGVAKLGISHFKAISAPNRI
jgi:hypothetical protein